jgi:hypothetical protein
MGWCAPKGREGRRLPTSTNGQEKATKKQSSRSDSAQAPSLVRLFAALFSALSALLSVRSLSRPHTRTRVVAVRRCDHPTHNTHTHTHTHPSFCLTTNHSFIHSFILRPPCQCVCVCVHVCLCVNNLFSFFPPFVCTPTDQPTNPTQFILLTALFSVCTEQPLSLLENTANLGIPFA